MNTEVNFEIAKLLKEKGFNKPCIHYYFEYGVFIENSYRDSVGMDYGSEFEVELCQLTENWNNGWLTKKNGERCFGCNKSAGYFETFSAPTIAEVIDWVYEKHGVWIQVTINHTWVGRRKEPEAKYNSEVVSQNRNLKVRSLINRKVRIEPYDTPLEAYEAAIEYTLNELI